MEVFGRQALTEGDPYRLRPRNMLANLGEHRSRLSERGPELALSGRLATPA